MSVETFMPTLHSTGHSAAATAARSCAKRPRQEARHVDRRGGEGSRNEAQEEQRVAEELRRGGEERHQRRLIDVAERGVAAANDEVELVAEEAVVRIGDGVERENDGGGEYGNALAGVFGHGKSNSRRTQFIRRCGSGSQQFPIRIISFLSWYDENSRFTGSRLAESLRLLDTQCRARRVHAAELHAG
jgi:hypothetical protein